jgi:ATP-binding protein involved in chromosome partitioning
MQPHSREQPAERATPAHQGPDAKFVVAVASGKGGVGKSTISLNVALSLAQQGAAVGVLDADFYGPDIPLMVGLTRKSPLKRWALWRAPELGGIQFDPAERFGIKIMSVGFLLAEDQHLFWPARMIEFISRQMLFSVRWGKLDYLIIDLPPGTADLQQQLIQLVALSGVIVVVGPQDVAHLDARKVVEMFEHGRVRILGGVENMSGVVCAHCGEEFDVFPHVREDRSIWALGVPRLGRVPLYPAVAEAGDLGRPVMVTQGGSPQAAVFHEIASALARQLDSAASA